MAKTDPVIEKYLPDLRNLCNEFEKKVIEQEEWAGRLAMLFWAISVLFVLWLLIDEKAIWYFAVGFICFTSELFAFLFGAGFLLYGPRSKANSMRDGLTQVQRSITLLEQNEVREACEIWDHLWSIDGLDVDGHYIIGEIKDEYEEKHKVGVGYGSEYY